MTEFRRQLEELINRTNTESGSDTPDFILADYLMSCLQAFDTAVNARTKWYRPAESEIKHTVVETPETPDVSKLPGYRPWKYADDRPDDTLLVAISYGFYDPVPKRIKYAGDTYLLQGTREVPPMHEARWRVVLEYTVMPKTQKKTTPELGTDELSGYTLWKQMGATLFVAVGMSRFGETAPPKILYKGNTYKRGQVSVIPPEQAGTWCSVREYTKVI